MTQELTTDDVRKKVVQLLKMNDVKALADIMEDMPSKEIVHLIGHLNRNDQMLLFTLLSPEDAAEVMEEIPDSQAVEIIEDLEIENAAAILNEMESDDQTDIIMELDDKDAQAILNKMEPEEAASVRKLLSYEYDTAGGMMHTEYFAFYEGLTIKDLIEDLRRNADKYEHFQLKYIFITARNNKLKGVVQMQDLLLSQRDSKLSQIKIKEVLSINHLASLDELIEFFNKNELFGVPVIDDENKLVGVILRKDILEAQTERITQEHLESQGIVGGDELRTMPFYYEQNVDCPGYL